MDNITPGPPREPIVKKSDYLYGIKYWAYWFIDRKPNYEVFLYMGSQVNAGIHWFYSRRDPKVTVYRTLQQCHTATFKPFLIDAGKVAEYCESHGLRSPL